MFLHTSTALLLSLTSFPHLAFARTFNVTIDDTNGDSVTGVQPTYAAGPLKSWHARPILDPCPECSLHLDSSMVYNGTWHDGMCLECGHGGTQPTSVSFRFTGTAIYIYGVLLANDDPSTTVTGMHVWFLIDGEIVNTFDYTPVSHSSTNVFLYNQLLYSNQSIPDGHHEFNMSARTNGPDSMILFDYAQYTTSDASSASNGTSVSPVPAPAPTPKSTPSSTPPKAKPVAIIVGAVIGSTILGVLLLAALLWWCKRRSARGQDAEYSGILETASQDASNRPPSIPPSHALFMPTESQAWTDLESEGISAYWGRNEKIHADPSVTTATLGAGSSVEHDSGLLEEVTLLRDEVERLRTYETAFLTPPSYPTLSTAGTEPETSRPNTRSSSDIHV